MSGSDQPGVLTRFVRSTFAFRKTTLTAFVVLSYLSSIIITYHFQNIALQLPAKVPDYFTNSWKDLQVISGHFHPYDSHANDDVHEYLKLRIEEIISSKPYISMEDTEGGKIMFSKHDDFDPTSLINRVIYFENGNILVKIEGSNPKLSTDGILISAHFDAVPTAKGSTDDGMGIASMLGILEYYSLKSTPQPERPIVFNFNNNEEFGLLGAYSFMDHEWSHVVKYFINLEGTGAGGRAILFRSSDYGVLSYYNKVTRPFANSLFQQAFKSGVVSSQTDYKVYTEYGLRGVDIAFFRPRALYHTPRDSISSTTKGSLWHMEMNSLEYLNEMASQTEILNDNKSDVLFFDFLGKFFICYPISQIYLLDVFLLTIFPLLTIVALLVIFKRGTWYLEIGKGFFRYPISLVISCVLTYTASRYIFNYDEYLVSNDYISPLLCFLSLFVISNYICLNFSAWSRPVHDQKLIGLLELNILFWVLKLYFTIQEQSGKNISSYVITIVYTLVSIASLFGLSGLMFKRKPKFERKYLDPVIYGSTENSSQHEQQQQPPQQEQQQQQSHQEGTSQRSTNSNNSTLASGEHSPLLGQQGGRVIVIEEETEAGFQQKVKAAALNSFNYDWSLQFLIVVPISILLFWNYGDLVLEGTHSMAQESSKHGKLAMDVLFGLAVLLGLPLLPFIHKLNAALAIFSILVFIVSGILCYLDEPFSYDNPMKLRFIQSIDLTNSSKPIVNIHGRTGFIKPVLENIPEIDVSKVWCNDYPVSDSQVCSYEGTRPWIIDGTEKENNYSNLLNIEVLKNSNANDSKSGEKYGPMEAEFLINAKSNRICFMNFNTTKYNSAESPHSSKMVSPVKIVSVFNDKMNNGTLPKLNEEMFNINVPSGHSYDPVTGTHTYKLMSGIDEVQLFKLDWDQDSYHFGVSWMMEWGDDDDDLFDGELGKSKDANLGVTVKCHWGEYDEEVVVDGGKHRMIPAFDELMEYSPNYVTYCNQAPGLVTIQEYVEL